MRVNPFVMKTGSLSVLTKYLLAWIPLPGIFNGVLRDLTYSHIAEEHRAHQISIIMLSTGHALRQFNTFTHQSDKPSGNTSGQYFLAIADSCF